MGASDKRRTCGGNVNGPHEFQGKKGSGSKFTCRRCGLTYTQAYKAQHDADWHIT